MNRLGLIGIIFVIAVVGGFFLLNNYIYEEKQGVADYRNLTFMIAGEPVTLVDGVSEVPAPDGGASKTITRYFGNEAEGDLNGDAIPDIVFLVTQESGGSGTFFYLVGALQTPAGTWNGTHAVLIGDRIAPQTTEYREGLMIVNYAERAPGEPMTAQPSVGKSLYLKYDPVTNQFGEVVQNFEGESAYETKCHDGAEYFTVTRGRADVGEDILVKEKLPGVTYPCRYTVSEGDIQLTNGNATYYFDIEGHFLVLDSGTAPHPRGLAIYDLDKRKEVYTDKYNTPIEVANGTVTYWQPIATKVDAKNCPKLSEYTAQGLGAGIERHVTLTLSTLKIAPTGEERCSVRQ